MTSIHNGDTAEKAQFEVAHGGGATPKMPDHPDEVIPSQPTRSAATEASGDDYVTKILRFLSTAGPESLGAVGVGLAAMTYFVLGKLGLILIGAFGGVVLFISWESRNPDVARAVRGEKGFDALARALEYAKARATQADALAEQDPDEAEHALAKSFDDFQPETRDALHSLVEAIIRDYVKWWYTPVLPADRSFPLATKRVLNSFLLSVSNHLSRKRPADAFLDFLTNSSSIVIVLFSELSAAFTDLTADSKATAADAVYAYLASNPNSNLANLLSQQQQANKFKMVAEDLLGFLDKSNYDCDPARVFLREILAGVVLEMTLQTCSKPEWINGWIVYLLEAGEPDFNQAIDVGMQTRPETGNAFVDVDGNVGNISLVKSNRNSFDTEKARRKDSAPGGHKKQLSKAEEEIDDAMEEMKRLNAMIEEDDARRTKDLQNTSEAEKRLAGAMKRNENELEMEASPRKSVDACLSSPNSSSPASVQPSSSNSNERSGIAKETSQTPLTPRSSFASSTQSQSPGGGPRFTSFDQIVAPGRDEPEVDVSATRKPPPLTLHNAIITIHDDPVPETNRLRTKPTWDYLIQIEPATSAYPGWMIVRKYSDFERLHEVLRRIAAISGAIAFTEQHRELPAWKSHTRNSLRGELERYVRDACWYQPLADSEGMKKFLEKGSTHGPSASKSGFQAFENMGKNMFDVLSNAPKGVADGGKMVMGGVSGVFGNIGLGPRKSTSSSINTTATTPLQDVTSYTNRLSTSTPPRMDSGLSVNTAAAAAARKSRDSLDSQRSSIVSTQPGKMPPMERRPSYNSQVDGETDGLSARPDRWDLPSPSTRGGSRQHSRASSLAPLRSPSATSLSGIKLPPPPEEISDDYGSPVRSRDSGIFAKDSLDSPRPHSVTSGTRKPKHFSTLSEAETRVAVELLFAVINELYTLSSAWNIRRTLLAAAKSFLLRPGNPSLVSIQDLIQTSVLDANTSDSGIAAHLRKLRENALPTEEELKKWPAAQTDEEKEKLRVKARKLLIQSGVPAALSGVMGQSATTDALGRIFDCLQIEEIARGLIFGIMLQAVRVVTH